jgi:hypothetical protein
MSINTKAQSDIRRKLKVLNHGKTVGNVSKTVGTSESLERHTTNGKKTMN